MPSFLIYAQLLVGQFFEAEESHSRRTSVYPSTAFLLVGFMSNCLVFTDHNLRLTMTGLCRFELLHVADIYGQ